MVAGDEGAGVNACTDGRYVDGTFRENRFRWNGSPKAGRLTSAVACSECPRARGITDSVRC